MFNIKGRITSKLLELPLIWLYGSKNKAELDLNNFKKKSLCTSNDEIFRAFTTIRRVKRSISKDF